MECACVSVGVGWVDTRGGEDPELKATLCLCSLEMSMRLESPHAFAARLLTPRLACCGQEPQWARVWER